MPSELTVSLIAFVGVIISALISFLVSVRQARNELRRMRTEIHKEFGSKLFEKRLQVYPELYALLSGFIKNVQSGKLSNSLVNDFVARWQEWDSHNAIFFSGTTGHISYELQRTFADLAKKSDEELAKEISSLDGMNKLRKKVGTLELALKHELGVFGFETPVNFEESKLVDDYGKAVSATAKNIVK